MNEKIPLINNISESGLYIPQQSDKTRENWRKELLDFGLKYISGRYVYEIPRQSNPLSIQIADDKFVSLVGENPRIHVPRAAADDDIFMTICKQNDICIVANHGYCVQGYDFHDQRSVVELGSFLVAFEKQYLSLKLQQDEVFNC